MLDKQSLIVIALVMALLVAIGLAAWYGQQSQRRPVATSGARFTAKAGTTRDKALALSSNKRSETTAPGGEGTASLEGAQGIAEPESLPDGDQIKTGKGGKKIRVRSISHDEEKEEAMSQTEREIKSAMNAIDPENGVDKLKQALEEPQNPEAAAKMYLAMGLLYAQMDPPDLVKSRQAFDQAISKATSLEMRQQIFQREVAMLLTHGQVEQARIQLAEAFAEATPSSPSRMQLGLMLGQLHEQQGNAEKAATIYYDILDQAMRFVRDKNNPLIEVARVAGLRLSNLYRDQGFEDRAEELAKELDTRLKALEGVQK